MDQSRILITGANGQLGLALRKRFPQAIAADRTILDITDQTSFAAFDWSKIDVILNAAAYTNVDGAQTPEGREAAWLANGTAVAYMAQAAIAHDLTLVNISSDYVFDGTKPDHREDEHLAPLGVYGQSKAAGEIATVTAPKHYLLRTSWVIGEGKNFVKTMMMLADKGVSPTVVGDQVGRLTFTDMLVDAIEHLLTNSCEYGTYNVSNDGDSASWAETTRVIFKELGRDDLKVTDTSTAEYFANKPDAAPRPLQSAFDLSKIKATGLVLRDWRDDLRDYIKQEKAAEAAKEQA
jgi:dTDP-4-dehydrorhamnose reductase